MVLVSFVSEPSKNFKNQQHLQQHLASQSQQPTIVQSMNSGQPLTDQSHLRPNLDRPKKSRRQKKKLKTQEHIENISNHETHLPQSQHLQPQLPPNHLPVQIPELQRLRKQQVRKLK